MTTPTSDDLTRIAWHVMDPDQRRSWAERVRQDKHMARYTVDELIEYRNKQHLLEQLDSQSDDIEQQIRDLQDQLTDVELQRAQAHNALLVYQAEIEGRALDRSIAAQREVHP